MVHHMASTCFFYLQKFLVAEELVDRSKRPKVEIQSLNTRAYLDHTVVPILLDAMAAVAKERWVHTHTHRRGVLRSCFKCCVHTVLM